MDGVLAGWRKGCEHLIYDEGYFLGLEENRELIRVLYRLKRKGVKLCIISCYLPESRYAFSEKLRWLSRHFPAAEEVFLVPDGEGKGAYLKKKGIRIRKEDILLDDRSANLFEWESCGGKAVKYLNGINGSGRKWKGLRADAESLQKIISGLKTRKGD